MTTSGGAALLSTSSNNASTGTLSNVTVAGLLDLSRTSSVLNVSGNLTLDGGTVLLGNHYRSGSSTSGKLYFRGTATDPAARHKARLASNNWRWQQLSRFPKPTIAMVNGYCFGGAFTQVSACDFASGNPR